jgi:hypothetical protein
MKKETLNLTIKLEENITDAPDNMTEEDPKIEPPLSFHTKIGNRQKSNRQHDQVTKRSSINLHLAQGALNSSKIRRITSNVRKGAMTERNASINMSSTNGSSDLEHRLERPSFNQTNSNPNLQKLDKKEAGDNR